MQVGPRGDEEEPRASRAGAELKRRTEDDREKQDITPGSSVHLVASLLHEEGPLLTYEVNEALPEVKEGTVGYALTEGYTRKIIDRERVESDSENAAWTSLNSLTEHGRALIGDYGVLTEDEWVNQ